MLRRRTVCQFPGHQSAVRGLTVSTDGCILVSCRSDSSVKLWSVPDDTIMETESSSDNSPKIEYDPRVINFRQLLEVFWSNHDSQQVFGQGPDVGNQYREAFLTLSVMLNPRLTCEFL